MYDMKNIAIYGAGGFGREVACLIQWINDVSPTWNLIGFFDDGKQKGEVVSHFGRIIGGLQELNAYEEELSIVFAIGKVGVVKKLHKAVINDKVKYPNIIAPDFIVRDPYSFKIGKGNIIQGRSSLTCDVTIGDFNVFNGAVNMGHDISIGNYNVIMPGVRISGEVTIGNDNFFGVGSVVLQELSINNNVKLAAGSVLMTKPKDNSLYLGVPAKLMKL